MSWGKYFYKAPHLTGKLSFLSERKNKNLYCTWVSVTTSQQFPCLTCCPLILSVSCWMCQSRKMEQPQVHLSENSFIIVYVENISTFSFCHKIILLFPIHKTFLCLDSTLNHVKTKKYFLQVWICKNLCLRVRTAGTSHEPFPVQGSWSGLEHFIRFCIIWRNTVMRKHCQKKWVTGPQLGVIKRNDSYWIPPTEMVWTVLFVFHYSWQIRGWMQTYSYICIGV